MSPRSVKGLVAVAVLASAACGGGDDGGGVAAGPSPLAELMGWDTDFDSAEMRRQELAREEAIADCMREEGWEYEPVDYSAQFSETSEEDVDLFADPEAYGEKYGYSVARNYELYEAEGVQSGDGPGMGTSFVDPNEDYVMSLTDDERTAYYATLYGGDDIWEDPEGEGEMAMPPLEEQGCQGRAELAVSGEDPMSDPDIQERMEDYWTNQQDDPRMQAAQDDWAECMGDDIAGLEAMGERVSRPDQMYQVFESRKNELMGLEERPIDPDDPSAYDGVYMSYGTDEDGTEIGWFGTPEPINDADLEALRTEEIAMWKVDWECQQDADIQELQRRIEQELVDELVAEFPELADDAEAAEGS